MRSADLALVVRRHVLAEEEAPQPVKRIVEYLREREALQQGVHRREERAEAKLQHADLAPQHDDVEFGMSVLHLQLDEQHGERRRHHRHQQHHNVETRLRERRAGLPRRARGKGWPDGHGEPGQQHGHPKPLEGVEATAQRRHHAEHSADGHVKLGHQQHHRPIDRRPAVAQVTQHIVRGEQDADHPNFPPGDGPRIAVRQPADAAQLQAHRRVDGKSGHRRQHRDDVRVVAGACGAAESE